MRILIIPDSFKENLSSSMVAKAIRQGIVNVLPKVNIKEIPFSGPDIFKQIPYVWPQLKSRIQLIH